LLLFFKKEVLTSSMFLSCGEAVIDLFATPGTFDLRAKLGGSPLNVAIGLARLGHQAGFLGCISHDTLGGTICSVLEQDGVDMSLVTRTKRPAALALVGLREDGVPDYGFYGLADAPAPVVPAVLPPGCRAIHVGSVGAALGESGVALEQLLRRERGARLLSYDPNVRLAVEPDVEVWRTRVMALAACADLVKVSAEDLEHLGVSPREAARIWLGGATRLVVVTDGGRGAEAYTSTLHVAVAAPAVTVVDTVGAGDSFQAALLAACADRETLSADALDRLDAKQLTEILTFAVQAAALTCTRAGADLPRRRGGILV
jgi:fructokinase